MFPAKVTYLFSQLQRIYLSISIYHNFHVANLLEYAPTGRPRYLRGTITILQCRNSTAMEVKEAYKLTPIRQLFQKFTLIT